MKCWAGILTSGDGLLHLNPKDVVKRLQGTYKLFRTLVYVSIMIEFFEYVVTDDMISGFGDWLVIVHQRIGGLILYQTGHLPYSKLVTLLLVIITCIATRNKLIEFDARKMVFWPIAIGFVLLVLSLWLFSTEYLDTYVFTLQIHTWLYMVATITGTLAVHVALDNASKYIKDGIMKDLFNFEDESFKQNEELQ